MRMMRRRKGVRGLRLVDGTGGGDPRGGEPVGEYLDEMIECSESVGLAVRAYVDGLEPRGEAVGTPGGVRPVEGGVDGNLIFGDPPGLPLYPDEMPYSDGVLPVGGWGESDRGGGDPAREAVMGEMVSFAALRRASFAASVASRVA